MPYTHKMKTKKKLVFTIQLTLYFFCFGCLSVENQAKNTDFLSRAFLVRFFEANLSSITFSRAHMDPLHEGSLPGKTLENISILVHQVSFDSFNLSDEDKHLLSTHGIFSLHQSSVSNLCLRV